MDGDEGESDMGLDSRGDRRSLRAVKACRGRKCREVPGSCYIDDGEATSCRVKSSRCTKSKLPQFRCNISENNQVIGGKVAPLQQQERKTCTAGE